MRWRDKQPTRESSVIRATLDHRGIRYIAFCQRVGVTSMQFKRIEDGDSAPPEGYYERAAEFLQLPAWTLMPRTAAEPKEVAS